MSILFHPDTKFESSLGQVLSALAVRNGVARHQLADDVGLTRATVTKAVQELIDAGIVAEVERGRSSPRGGPRPILLEVCRDAVHVIGLDIRREKVTGCRVDLAATLRETVSVRLDPTVTPETLLESLYEIVDRLKASCPDVPLGAIGVGSIGPVDVLAGRSHPMNFPVLDDLPVCDLLAKRYQVPTTIRIGAMAAAYGEERLAMGESGRPKSIAFVVIDFRGIGLGLISGGAGWLTDHGGVGEVGHVAIDINGRPCECGRRGCLVQYASGLAALRMRDASGTGFGHSETMLSRLALDAEGGDEPARKALVDAGRYLGSAIVDIDRLLRPSRIVLGSSHDHMAKWYMKGVHAYIDAVHEASDFTALQERLMLARKGSAAIAYGAAALQIKNFTIAPSAILGRLSRPGGLGSQRRLSEQVRTPAK